MAIWAVWKDANLWWFALALVLQFVGIALSAAKWGVLLRSRGYHQPFRWLLSAYLVGQFANNFLPTTVGGDALRTMQLGRRIGSYSRSAASIFVERLTGFLALSLIANVALALTIDAFTGVQLVTSSTLHLLTIGFSLLAVIAAIGCFVAPWVEQKIGRYLPGLLQRPMHRIANALSDFFPQGQSLALVIWMSLLFQSLWIVIHMVCGQALNIDAPLLIYAVMAPITDILGLAPIFVNNLGAREFVFTTYLTQVGVEPASAIALAMMIFAVRLAVSLVGGLIVLFGGADLHVTQPGSQDAVSSES
ncbi:MAG: flippase-like domain-containing protein [Chloroflexaceae bacterium]|nr:flippase-like domain-containing protein [Chloroflexaceae bacterium]